MIHIFNLPNWKLTSAQLNMVQLLDFAKHHPSEIGFVVTFNKDWLVSCCVTYFLGFFGETGSVTVAGCSVTCGWTFFFFFNLFGFLSPIYLNLLIGFCFFNLTISVLSHIIKISHFNKSGFALFYPFLLFSTLCPRVLSSIYHQNYIKSKTMAFITINRRFVCPQLLLVIYPFLSPNAVA